jgi:hypothetical protein
MLFVFCFVVITLLDMIDFFAGKIREALVIIASRLAPMPKWVLKIIQNGISSSGADDGAGGGGAD